MSYSKPHSKYFPVIKTAMLPAATFSGKTALITGGGTGLGKGICKLLSSLGASCAIIGRRQKVLEETANEIESKSGNRVIPLSADVRDSQAIKRAIDTIEKELGLPTMIINNAAGNFISPAERLSSNAYRTIVDIVLNGTANVTLDMGKRLIAAQKGASFVSIIATYTFLGSGFVSPSASAKSGVEALTKSLAAEWGRYGIRLNCIAPGPFVTEGASSRLNPMKTLINLKSPMEEKTGRLPVGRYGEIEELSNLTSYLLSDYSNWMTGGTVVMDGGRFGYGACKFNKLLSLSKDEWDQIEATIRQNNAKSKEKGN